MCMNYVNVQKVDLISPCTQTKFWTVSPKEVIVKTPLLQT